jgi:hypothetical protein
MMDEENIVLSNAGLRGAGGCGMSGGEAREFGVAFLFAAHLTTLYTLRRGAKLIFKNGNPP